ncbi:P-loop NTPase fold protein [Rhizobium ruizarguesonis]|uniref:P-loop NTPase fold protein n=1 Tax=Rhizobium ruizarguesonis TaxID=2081791 RepID=UPI0013EEA2F2|nr:P-loop NTPase fold protein [Rhizobium ruizarguesonis]
MRATITTATIFLRSVAAKYLRLSIRVLGVVSDENVSGPDEPSKLPPTAEQLAVAFSLVSLIKTETTGEAAFAMFGAWGRGKTFTSETVRKHVKDEMVVVRFPSWLYPNKPECWAHLYRTIFEGLLKENRFALYASIVRMNLERSGLWQPIFSIIYVMLWLFLGSSLTRFNLLWILLVSVGPVTLLFLFKIALAVPQVLRHFRSIYWRVESHSDKLGLQETIGRDLRDLISAWGLKRSKVIRPLLAIIPFLFLLPPATMFSYAWYRGAEPIAYLLAEKLPLAAWTVFCATGLVLVVVVETIRSKKLRVLVIIEDLDRVSAEHSLSITESVSVFLADNSEPAVMHFLFLLDERALDHAVQKRHGETADRNFAYYLKERLFKAHIRLPPMSTAEARATSAFIIEKDVLEKLLQAQQNRQAEINALNAELLLAVRKVAGAEDMKIIRTVEVIVKKASIEVVEVPPRRRNPSTREIQLMGEEAFLPETKTVQKPAETRLRDATEEEVEASKRKRENAIKAANAVAQAAKESLERLKAQLVLDEEAIIKFKGRLSHTDEGATKILEAVRVGDEERRKIVDFMGELSEAEGVIWGPRAVLSFLRKFEMMMTLWHYLVIRTEIAKRPLHEWEKSVMLDALYSELVQLLCGKTVADAEIIEAGAEAREQAHKLAKYVI